MNDPAAFLKDSGAGVLDISYADDTLLMSSSVQTTELYLKTLIEVARPLGLEPNWGKTMHLRIGHKDNIHTPAGIIVKAVSQAVYLGSLLTASGHAAAALARRIGEARGMFHKLCAVWRHANLVEKDKLRIFDASVASKLLYSLEC